MQNTPIQSVVLGGQWQHIVVDATFAFPDGGNPSGTYTLRTGSPTSAPIFQGPLTPLDDVLNVAVGVDGFGSWTVNYDNVVINVR